MPLGRVSSSQLGRDQPAQLGDGSGDPVGQTAPGSVFWTSTPKMTGRPGARPSASASRSARLVSHRSHRYRQVDPGENIRKTGGLAVHQVDPDP